MEEATLQNDLPSKICIDFEVEPFLVLTDRDVSNINKDTKVFWGLQTFLSPDGPHWLSYTYTV